MTTSTRSWNASSTASSRDALWSCPDPARNQAPSIGIGALFGLLFAVPILVGFLPGSLSDEIGKYLPGAAGLAVTTVHADPATSLAPWTGFGVFCAYAVGLLGFAAVRMRRVDV